MTPYAAADISLSPPWQEGSKSALWWGAVTLAAITSCVYAALIASYFYLRQGASNWPAGPFDVQPLFWPTVGTACRLAAEPFMILANRSARKDGRAGIIIGLAAALVLLIGWMVQVIEVFFGLPFDWTYATYGSINWAMQAWAFIAAASVAIWLLVELIWAIGGHFNRERRVGLQILKIYTTAQTAGWIFLWTLIYFGPRVFHKP
jgi:heme/copper-type cytochrome/quinol oxidase subunit 3